MRHIGLCLLFMLFACGDNDHGVSRVDMTFIAQVEELENTCGTQSVPDDTLAFVDVYLHADDTVELRPRSGWIPGPGSYPNIHVGAEGTVDYHATRASEAAGRSFDHNISGMLTMDDMDLELEVNWYRYADDGEKIDCVTRVRMFGLPRALHDDEATEGIYQVALSYYGELCGGETRPANPLGLQTFLFDVFPTETELRLNLDGIIYAWTDLPQADGQVSWNGTTFITTTEGFEEAATHLEGTLRPDMTSLDFDFTLSTQPSDCRYVYTIDGRKRLASVEEASGDYRAQQTFWDECKNSTDISEAPIAVIVQSETVAEVRDGYGDWFVNLDGDHLYASGGSEAEGFTASFEGRIDPPDVRYTFTYNYLKDNVADFVTDDGWCTQRLIVDGISRYFPDLEWDPTTHP